MPEAKKWVERRGSGTMVNRFGWLGILVICVTGCQQWPGNQAMRQYQVESERLLSEFRSQKKRAEDLEKRNYQLEQRLGEGERALARLQGGAGGGEAER